MSEEPVGAAAKLETARNMETMDQFLCPAVHFFTCTTLPRISTVIQVTILNSHKHGFAVYGHVYNIRVGLSLRSWCSCTMASLGFVTLGCLFSVAFLDTMKVINQANNVVPALTSMSM